jgi:hypothetical protein
MDGIHEVGGSIPPGSTFRDYALLRRASVLAGRIRGRVGSGVTPVPWRRRTESSKNRIQFP